MRLVGHAIDRWSGSPDSEQVESSWWVGKPWRRVELVVVDSVYREKRTDRAMSVSVHVGWRRLGWHASWVLTRERGLDYSDEPNQ